MLPLPDGFPKPPKVEIAEEGCAKGLVLGGAANKFEPPPKGDDTRAALVEDEVNLKPEEESFLARLPNAEEVEPSDEVPKVKGVAVVAVFVVVAVVFVVSGSDDDARVVDGNLNGEGVAFPAAGIEGAKPPPLFVSPSLKVDEPNVLFPKDNELGGAGIAGGRLG